MTQKAGRNDPCPCGSGKKYKQCCLKKQGQAKTYTSSGKRKIKAKVLSSSAKTAGIFQQQSPPIPHEIPSTKSLEVKFTDQDYHEKSGKKPLKFDSSKKEPIKQDQPLQLPEGEFKPTDVDYKEEEGKES